MWAGLNGFDPRNDLVLGVRIGMGCMNLVTAISRFTPGTRNLNYFRRRAIKLKSNIIEPIWVCSASDW